MFCLNYFYVCVEAPNLVHYTRAPVTPIKIVSTVVENTSLLRSTCIWTRPCVCFHFKINARLLLQKWSFWRWSATCEKKCRCMSQPRWVAVMILIFSGVKVACEPVVGIADHFHRRHRDRQGEKEWLPNNSKGKLLLPHPLVEESDFIMWLMQQDSDFTRRCFSD